jgi:hypothetical protein
VIGAILLGKAVVRGGGCYVDLVKKDSMRPSLSFCRAVLENFTNSDTVQRYGGESERWGGAARHHTKFGKLERRQQAPV